MKNKKSIEELIDELEWLYKKYSLEMRAGTQPYYLNPKSLKKYDPKSRFVRETLLEHVGVLPVIATTVFPYIKDKKVDLGKALTMLAIHDIGELEVGDEITFTKKPVDKLKEQEAALKILDPIYHDLYLDVESQKSQTAKFAKSIDKLAGDILDYVTPAEITIERFKHFVGVDADEIVPLIIKHKRPYMLWNPFLTDIHKVLIQKMRKKLSSL